MYKHGTYLEGDVVLLARGHENGAGRRVEVGNERGLLGTALGSLDTVWEREPGSGRRAE